MSEQKQQKEIVFFVDKEQCKTEKAQLTVREILQDFAKEDPNENTLVFVKGNERNEYSDLNEVIPMVNGMKFIVFNNGQTNVS